MTRGANWADKGRPNCERNDVRDCVRNYVRGDVRNCVRMRTTWETAGNRKWAVLASPFRTSFRSSFRTSFRSQFGLFTSGRPLPSP